MLPYFAPELASGLFAQLPLLLGTAVGVALLGMLYSHLSRMRGALLASSEIDDTLRRGQQDDTSRERLQNVPINPIAIPPRSCFDAAI